MSRKHSKQSIYKLEWPSRRSLATRRVLEKTAYVEVDGVYEATTEIMSRTKRAALPPGPKSVPAKDAVNPIGSGSGFISAYTLKLVLKVSDSDSERMFEDVWHGSDFRPGCWIVSTHFKSLLISVDPQAFEFLPIVTELDVNGRLESGPERWLCDLTRFLTAIVRPESSDLEKARDGEIHFNQSAIGDCQFFREASKPSEWIFCSHSARTAITEDGITGLAFKRWGVAS